MSRRSFGRRWKQAKSCPGLDPPGTSPNRVGWAKARRPWKGRAELITREEAERIAEEIVGARSDNPVQGWDLEEFREGWLILERGHIGHLGKALRVIERDSGRVMRFGSPIAPDRILKEYTEILQYGRPQD